MPKMCWATACRPWTFEKTSAPAAKSAVIGIIASGCPQLICWLVGTDDSQVRSLQLAVGAFCICLVAHFGYAAFAADARPVPGISRAFQKPQRQTELSFTAGWYFATMCIYLGGLASSPGDVTGNQDVSDLPLRRILCLQTISECRS